MGESRVGRTTPCLWRCLRMSRMESSSRRKASSSLLLSWARRFQRSTSDCWSASNVCHDPPITCRQKDGELLRLACIFLMYVLQCLQMCWLVWLTITSQLAIHWTSLIRYTASVIYVTNETSNALGFFHYRNLRTHDLRCSHCHRFGFCFHRRVPKAEFQLCSGGGTKFKFRYFWVVWRCNSWFAINKAGQ